MKIIDNIVAYQPQLLPSTEVAKFCTYKHTSTSKGTYYGRTFGLFFTIEELNHNRWNNGLGYTNHKVFYNAIQKYGWDNFKHEICKTHLFNWECSFVEYCGVLESKASGHSYNISIPQVGGCPMTHEQCVINAYKGGQRNKELGKGICALTHDQHVEIGKSAGENNKKNRVGFLGWSHEQFVENGKKTGKIAGQHNKEFKIGFCGFTHEQCVEYGKRGSQRAKELGVHVRYFLFENGVHGSKEFIVQLYNVKLSVVDEWTRERNKKLPKSLGAYKLLAVKNGSDFTDEEVQQILSTYNTH